MRHLVYTFALLLSTTWAIGCGQSAAGPTASADGARYLLAEEPAGALGVLDVREEVEAAGAGDYVVVGRIGGVANPWGDRQASFLIVDPAAEIAAQDHHHADGQECKFCKENREKQMLSSLAIVEMVDEQGKTVPTDARQLLGVAADQTVVVRGRAKRNEEGHLIISAAGIYIRR